MAEAEEGAPPALDDATTPVVDSRGWPCPVPVEWQEGRKARAEAWFQERREQTIEAWREKQHQHELKELAAARQKAEAAWAGVDVQRFRSVQERTRDQAARTLESYLASTFAQHTPPEHVVRLPHFTALRPVTLLASEKDDTPFGEQLLIRALASSLLGNCTSAGQPAGAADAGPVPGAAAGGGEGPPPPSAAASSLAGFGDLLAPGCAGSDLLWWGPMQPHSARDDPLLASLEAVGACRVCLVLLSPSLISSPGWPALRDALAARMLGQQAINRPLTLLVLSLSHHPLSPAPRLELPPSPRGAPSTGTRMVQVQVPCQVSPEEQLMVALEAARGVLPDACVRLAPAELLELHFQPAAALQAALRQGLLHHPASRLRNGLAHLDCRGYPGAPAATVTGTGVGLACGVLAGPLDSGPACTLALGLPHPLGNSKPLVEWDVQDVRVWVQAQGGAVASLAPALVKYGVDGALLSVLRPQHLSRPLGLAGDPATGMLAAAIRKLQERHQAGLPPGPALQPERTQSSLGGSHLQLSGTGGVGGTSLLRRSLAASTVGLASTTGLSGLLVTGQAGLLPGADDPLLLTCSREQLEQAFRDVVRYYDADCTGDLKHSELSSLLAAAGINLSEHEVATVLKEADHDNDGRLSAAEALAVMWDVWRLIIASRDATTWNVPSAVQAMTHAHAGGAAGARKLGANRSRRTTQDTHASDASGAAGRHGSRGHTTHRLRSSMSQMGGASSAHDHSSSRRMNSSRSGAPAGSLARALSTAASVRRGVSLAADSPRSRAPTAGDAAASAAGGPAADVLGKRAPVGDGTRTGHVSFAARAVKPSNGPKTQLISFASRGTSSAASHAGADPASPLTRQALAALSGGAGLGASVAPWGHAHGDEDSAAEDASRHAATVATDLDVFHDPALLAAPRLRGTSEPADLAATLSRCLKAADLRRTGALTPSALRAALASGMASDTTLVGGGLTLGMSVAAALGVPGSGLPDDQRLTQASGSLSAGPAPEISLSAALSPAELRLLVDAVLPACCQDLAPGQQDVSIPHFVDMAVAATAEAQSALMDVVYTPSGTQRLLYRLHAQVYPHSVGFVEGLGEGAVQASEQTVASVTSSNLASTKVPFDEAPALLDVVVTHLGLSVPLMVRAALLQEAAAVAERCAGSGTEVEAWSCTVAHMLHVWSRLHSGPEAHGGGVERGQSGRVAGSISSAAARAGPGSTSIDRRQRSLVGAGSRNSVALQ